MEAVTLNVPNIIYGHCMATVKNPVGKFDGLQTVSRYDTSANVDVTWDAARSTWL